MRLRFIIFVSLHILALLLICLFKIFPRPVRTEIIRTSIMSKSEKDELISGVLTVLSTNNFYSASSVTNASDNALLDSPRSVDGCIYYANGSYIYRSSAGFDFIVGDICPYDFKPIIAIYKQCFQTSTGSFIVGSSSAFSSRSSSPSSSSRPMSFSDLGVKL